MCEITIRVPGSCGELVQGSIGGRDFLVSCPINLYSRVNIQFIQSKGKVEINRPAPRTLQAVEHLLKIFALEDKGLKINIDSDLIDGAGMASSTADIAAASAALMMLTEGKIDLELLKNTLVNIEPSDSVFLEGLQIFNHRSGEYTEKLGEAPEMAVLLFKEPGRVDSLEFNRNEKLAQLNRAKEKEIKEALRLLKKGIKEKNCRLIGRAATISSLAHQQILAKKNLEELIELSEDYQEIYGVNIAHSGTLIGIMTSKSFKKDEFTAKINEKFPELKFLREVELISGGIEMRVDNGRSAWRKLDQGSSRERIQAGRTY